MTEARVLSVLRFVAAAATCGVVASCSSAESGPPGSSPSSNDDAGASDAAATDDTGTQADTGSSDTGSTPDGGATGADVVTLTFDPFDVAPGAEVYKCQNFANPFGVDTDIQKFQSDMTAGSHHLLLFYKDNLQSSGVADCSGLEFDATPYGSQTPHDNVTYPDGIAALLPKGKGIRLQSHYLNTGTTTVRANITVTLYRAKAGSVKNHAGVLFVNHLSINVPPHSTTPVTHNCKLPQDMNLLGASSHMHKHGTGFVATSGAQALYQTDTWDNPRPALFTTPIAIHQGDPLSFTCTFVNDGSDTLRFGESAQTNEMCIFTAQFYPVTSASNVTVSCN